MPKSEKGVVEGKLDLDRASEEELAAIDGIGPARARAIVEWRSREGRFETVEDLQHVGDSPPEAVRGLREKLEVRRRKE